MGVTLATWRRLRPATGRAQAAIPGDRARLLTAYPVAVGGVAACTGLIALLRLPLPGAQLAILYLLPVLAAASVGGRGPALTAAVLSFLTYNYAFVEPVFTLAIRDPGEWPTLLVFLFTALVAGQLAATLRLRAEEARARAGLLADLYGLTQALITDRDAADLLALIAAQVVVTFRVRECAILLPDATGRLTVRARSVSGVLGVGGRHEDEAEDAPRTIDQASAAPAPPGTALFVPLLAGARRVGLMRVVHDEGAAPDEERRRLLPTFAAGAALAIERGLLAEATARAATLARSDALKSTLLSAVSHELRTPLAAIKGSVSSLLEDETIVRWDPAQRREFLLTIDEETDRLTRLVADLLDLSRIEAGVLRPRREPYALDELLWATIARLAPDVATRVQLRIPADLPLVPLDPLLMDRVVGNLLENALKYSPPAAPVTLTVRHRDDTVELVVADRGPGVAPDERERIFERFHRAAPTRAITGLGLGLALSRALVEAHGGRIRVEGAMGGGAAFIVALPVQPLTLPATPTTPAEAPR
jgi:two-component system sensor histidine kinase KdpD